MATTPCCNEFSEPDDTCCPDSVDIGNYVDVRGRDCRKKKMPAPLSGLFGAHHKKWLALDGSDAKPIVLNLNQQIAVNGYVVAQDKSGRILAVKPDADLATANAILQFGFKDGELKFFPISLSELTWSDADVPTTKAGFLAALACAGDGQLTLGKFDPECVTEDGQFKYLKIGFDGEVVCEDHNVGECPDVAPVEELDSLWGCNDGIMSPILPEVGKTLIGEGDPVKWVKGDALGNTLSVARSNIFTRSILTSNAGALDSENIDITLLPGYNAQWKLEMLHFRYDSIASTDDYTHVLSVDGRRYCAINILTGSFSGDSNDNSALVVIPDNKIWAVTNQRTFFQAGSGSGYHYIDIWIDGWMK